MLLDYVGIRKNQIEKMKVYDKKVFHVKQVEKKSEKGRDVIEDVSCGTFIIGFDDR